MNTIIHCLVKQFDAWQLAEMYVKLQNAIQKHHEDTYGHGMCWENDVELWKSIDINVYPHDSLPPEEEFLCKCKEYYNSRKKL